MTRELQRFVDSVPNGATVVFPRGARYRIDGTLQWRGRVGLTLLGHGAMLFAGTHGGPTRAHVRLLDGRDWTIRDLAVNGADPSGGRFDARYQWQHGFDLRGVDGAVLQNVKVSNVFGDDVYVGLSTTSSRWSRDIEILNSIGRRSGRMAVAITAGRRVTVRGGLWSDPGLDGFDIEPNGPPGGADRILIEGARIQAGAHGSALAVTGRGPVSNVTMRDNFLIGTPLTVQVGEVAGRPRNIAVEANTSATTFDGPGPAAMVFRNTDGVTVTGNTQPIKAGMHLVMVATEESTQVNVSGSHVQLTRARSSIEHAVALVIALMLVLAVAGRWVARRAASVQRRAR